VRQLRRDRDLARLDLRDVQEVGEEVVHLDGRRANDLEVLAHALGLDVLLEALEGDLREAEEPR